MREQELRAFHRHHRQAQRSIHCEREWDFACVCGTIACTHIVRNKDMDHSVIVVHGAGKCIGSCKAWTHTSCSVTCIFLFDAFHYCLQACSELRRHWDLVVTI